MVQKLSISIDPLCRMICEVPSHKALARCLAEMAADAINERAKLRRRQVLWIAVELTESEESEKIKRIQEIMTDDWNELNFMTLDHWTCYPKEVL